jgi:hypothetical protein
MFFFTCLFKVSKPLTFFRLAKYSIWLSPNDFDAPRNHKLSSEAPATRLGRDKARKVAPACFSALAIASLGEPLLEQDSIPISFIPARFLCFQGINFMPRGSREVHPSTPE